MHLLQGVTEVTHAQAILWEIDMLRFTAESIGTQESFENWRNLECFLLHFRNLIEFFGKKPEKDDLSILKPETIWPERTRPSDGTLKELSGESLWNKYAARRDNAGNLNQNNISRYLHHCTEQRVKSRTWPVREMFDEIKPLIDLFEELSPEKNRPWTHRQKNWDSSRLPASLGTPTITRPFSPLGVGPTNGPIVILRDDKPRSE